MRVLLNLVGAVAVLAGLWLMYMAYSATSILQGSLGATALAVQVTQVYSQASFYGIMAVAAFAFAGVLVLASAQTAPGKEQESPFPTAPRPMK